MFGIFNSIFSSTVGKHNKNADDWLGENSWWGKLTGKAGEVVKDEVGRDIKAKGQEQLITQVLIGFIIYTAFIK